MITLNEIAYNIKNLAYGGQSSLENKISIQQIKHWIHYHRAKLCIDLVNKNQFRYDGWTQSLSVTTRNAALSDVAVYDNAWDIYNKNIASSPPSTASTYVQNLPKDSSGELSGQFIALGSISADISSQTWREAQNLDVYGRELRGTKKYKGDFRNFGIFQGFIPKPIILPGKDLVKVVKIQRSTHFPDDFTTAQNEAAGGATTRTLSLYQRSNEDLFYRSNKFTGSNDPFYSLHSARSSFFTLPTHWNSYNRKNPQYFIKLNNLEISPNYHGDLHSPGEKKIFWKYSCDAQMVLENPTEISFMKNFIWSNEEKFDDAETIYPIPLEYVSDLIQRVLQIEIQTELKTMPDMIVDGQDDNEKMKKSGARVQR